MEIKVGDLIQKAKVSRCGDGDYPVLSMTMHEGLMFQNDRFKKQIASVDQSNYQVVKRHQLVESFPIDEGVLAVQELTDEGIVSPAYKIWDVNMDKVIPIYLELALRSPRSIEYYKSKLRGTTARRRSITDAEFCAMQINCPDLREQKRIIELITRAKAIAAKRQQELDTLDELIKARFVEMFGDPVENPKGYRVDNLQALIDAGDITYHLDGNHGGDYPRSEEFVSEGVPYIGANCISNGEIDFSLAKYLTVERAGKLRKGIAQNEDVLFAHNATVGPTVVLHTTEPKVILSTSLTAYRCNKESIMPEYLATYMKSDGFVMQYSSEMKQTTRNQVPITAQKKYLFLIPPMEEQKAFSEFVKQVDKSKVAVQKSLDETQKLFDSLMQEYFG